MIRSQIYLTEEEREALARLAQETGRPQSELIREAIDAFLARQAPRERGRRLRQAFGLWQKRTDLPDFGALRQEWDRPG
ncbi:MAG TPA: CopG family transcriptional regulator [Gammaproteobacteria bacterium]